MAVGTNPLFLFEILRVQITVMPIQNEQRFPVAFNSYRRIINLVSQKFGAVDCVLSQNPMVVVKVQVLFREVAMILYSADSIRCAEFEGFAESVLIHFTIGYDEHHCIGGAVFEGEVFGDFGEDRHLYSLG